MGQHQNQSYGSAFHDGVRLCYDETLRDKYGKIIKTSPAGRPCYVDKNGIIR